MVFDGTIHTKQKSVQNLTFWEKKGKPSVKESEHLHRLFSS